jgi:hypothetical protein
MIRQSSIIPPTRSHNKRREASFRLRAFVSDYRTALGAILLVLAALILLATLLLSASLLAGKKIPAEAGFKFRLSTRSRGYRLGAGAVLVGPGVGAPGATGPLVAEGAL